MRHAWRALIVATLVLFAALGYALACACCTNQGQRNVNVVALDANKRETLQALRFGDEAKLYLGEADPDAIGGIASPSAAYELKAAWQGGQLVFNFADGHGHTGTLALGLPGKISIFEVDPRNAPDQGTGPTLYKEWKLTGKVAGSGVFGGGVGAQQLLTLIVQGSGNSCTGAGDFAHWTLVMQGPKANYTLFGELVR
jgi:hypothetical protein